MKIFLLIFLIFVVQLVGVVICDDSFVAFWAPKGVNEGRSFDVTIFSSNLQNEIKAGIQFRDSNQRLFLKNDEFEITSFENTNHLARSGSTMTLTLHRSSASSGMTNNYCSTKTIKIFPDQRNFYIFIQTDKPIYKPGDDVKFRILVIDRDLKPFHMNTLKVDIVDPFGQIIKTFNDISGQYLGVFENTFKLSTSTILGEWRIYANVDNKQQFTTIKQFDVQKYSLPLFEVNVETSEKHYDVDSEVQMSFFAKYSFGEFVTGNAELVIQSPQNGRQFFTKSFQNVENVMIVTYDIKYDINVDTNDEIELEAVVTFTEKESGISYNKSTTFYAHNGKINKIIPRHPSKFSTNFDFTIIVHVNDWKGERETNQNENVEVKFTFTTTDYNTFGKIAYAPLVNGKAILTLDIPDKADSLHLEIKYGNSKIYRAKILPGGVTEGVNELVVEHKPQNPKLHQKVKISIKGDSKLNKVLSIITNKSGNINSQIIDCNNEENCEFDVTIKQEMMPLSTVTVYHVVDKSHIYQGSTEIRTEGFKENYLNIDLSKTRTQTKKKIQMNFSTIENSKIYILAFDKSLTFLRDGNDITKDDVYSAMGNYNGTSQLIVDDLSTWHICSYEELKRVDIQADGFGERTIFGSSGYHKPKELSNLRQDFPETWIFESFEIGNRKTALKEFTTPDSITTWVISAFSLNNDKGLAIAQTQELTVMNEFFVKMNLPYSIKFNEVLRLDILAYNYIETRDFLEVDVELENLNGNEFQFVEYSKVRGSCSASFNNNERSTKSTGFMPYMSVKKVSFHIRSNPTDTEFDEKVQKKIQLKVIAKAKGRYGMTYEDQVLRELIIEPVGVKDFMISSQDYKLNGARSNTYTHKANFTEDLSNVNVIVGGDYMSNVMDLSSRYELYPSDCLEQKTSKLKGNVEYFRYLLARETNPSTEHFSNYYQSLLVERTKNWNYYSFVGYRAYFLEAVASAMEIGAIPRQSSIIETELDYLKEKQENSGKFESFGSFPYIDTSHEGAYVFQTAFVLIPFIKFKGLVDENYDDVIRKGFDYIKANEGSRDFGNEGLAIAAYAYALNNESTDAKGLLDEVEKLSVHYESNKKCYKIRPEDLICRLSYTTYAALAYIQLGEISKALPLVNWIITEYNVNYYYSNTVEYALTTEPIAKLAKYLKTDRTSLTITLKNEYNFQKLVSIKNENSGIFQDIEFPKHSRDVISIADGYGYCSITTIFERIILLPQMTSKFSLSVNPKNGNLKDKIVQICAEYHGKSELMNVIYEVEMPSGYIYSEIIDIENKRNSIKLVTEKRKGTMIYIYYNDFKRGIKYCVDVKVRKSFDVRDAKLAGVKVYDYFDKKNIAVEFYKFSTKDC